MSYAQVKEFMQAFGQATPEEFAPLNPTTKALRLSLIREELQELQDSDSIVDEADALTDLKYVIHGTAIAIGYELEDIIPTDYAPIGWELSLSDIIWLLTNSVDRLEVAFDEDNYELAMSALVYMIADINRYAVDSYIPIALCMDEVHASNMSKLGEDGKPIYRDDGKVLKGLNYFPPNLRTIILGETNAA